MTNNLYFDLQDHSAMYHGSSLDERGRKNPSPPPSMLLNSKQSPARFPPGGGQRAKISLGVPGPRRPPAICLILEPTPGTGVLFHQEDQTRNGKKRVPHNDWVLRVPQDSMPHSQPTETRGLRTFSGVARKGKQRTPGNGLDRNDSAGTQAGSVHFHLV